MSPSGLVALVSDEGGGGGGGHNYRDDVIMMSPSGLVALVSDEVHELMAKDYSRKYQEYMDVVQEREFQATLRRKIMETKRVASMGVLVSLSLVD